MSVALFIAAAGAAAVTAIAARDHRNAKAARRAVLDDCAGALDRSTLTHGDDGYPQISGSHRGRGVLVQLLLDTMTIRRLPQLWLSATMLDFNPGLPGFAILVRHNGSEFYSLVSHFSQRLDAPTGFPEEVLIRGDDGAGPVLAALAPTIAVILKDARIKEITVTERGLRIVRQSAEGKRGEHLLLRQSVFENAKVVPADMVRVLEQLHAMRDIVHTHAQACAA